MQAKRNKIAPVGVFFMLFISRIVVSLTTTQSVSTAKVGSDIIISIAGALLLSVLFSVPALYCVRKGKNPIDNSLISLIYGLYFIFLAGLNISRFSYFASTTLNPDSQAWIFTLIVTICACYGAYLGIEGLARFSAFAFILLIVATFFVIACNIGNYEELNLYPVLENGTQNVVKNILIITTSTTEIAVFLSLSQRVNGDSVKQYIYAIICAFIVIIILFLFAVAVMGNYAKNQPFPIYYLFQQAKIGGFERVDVLHISFWILGILIKASLLIYCASVSFKNVKQKTGTMVASVGTFAVATIIGQLNQTTVSSLLVTAIPFVLFCVVLPGTVLIFKKGRNGDRLAKSS